MYMQPRLITPPNGYQSWQAIEAITRDRNAFINDSNYVPPPEIAYLSRYMLTLQDVMPEHQRKALRFLADKEQRRPESAPANQLTQKDILDLSQFMRPNLAGFVNTVYGETPRFADVMMELGLAWFASLAGTEEPSINVDQIDMFSEKTHKNPHQTLMKIGRTTDPVERSRLGLLLNRWIQLRSKDNKWFHFRFAQTPADLNHIDWSHLNLKYLEADSKSLTGSNLKAADLSESNLSGSVLDDVDALGAVFNHAYICEAKMRNARLKYADLSQVDGRGTDFTDSDMTGAVMSGIRLEGAIMDRVKIGSANKNKPRTISVTTGQYSYTYELATSINTVDQNTRWRNAIIFNTKFSNSTLVFSEFDKTTFTDVTFANCQFAGSRFINCVFSGNIKFEDCSFSNFDDFDGLIQAARNTKVTLINPAGLSFASLQHLKQAGIVIEKKSTPPAHAVPFGGCRI